MILRFAFILSWIPVVSDINSHVKQNKSRASPIHMMRLLVIINIYSALQGHPGCSAPQHLFFILTLNVWSCLVHVRSGLCAEDFISKRPLYLLMRDVSGNILIFSHIHPPISAETARPGPGGPERERERESMRKVKGNEDERKRWEDVKEMLW